MKINTLVSNQIMEAINGITNGRIDRIIYKSEMPLKAEKRNAGIKLVKITAVSARFGINYNNLPAVIEKRAQGDSKQKETTNNYEWVVKNKIAHHTKNNNYYVRITYLPKGNNRKCLYILQDNDKEYIVDNLTDEMKELVINSYWDKKSISEVQNIQFNNIIRIGKIGQKII